MPSRYRSVSLLMMAALTLGVVHGFAGQAKPVGELIWAWHVTIAPAWFDPSTAPAQITPLR